MASHPCTGERIRNVPVLPSDTLYQQRDSCTEPGGNGVNLLCGNHREEYAIRKDAVQCQVKGRNMEGCLLELQNGKVLEFPKRAQECLIGLSKREEDSMSRRAASRSHGDLRHLTTTSVHGSSHRVIRVFHRTNIRKRRIPRPFRLNMTEGNHRLLAFPCLSWNQS